MDTSLALTAALGMLLVRLGMALVHTGSVRAKNSVTVLVRGLIELSLAVLVFAGLGVALALARGGNGIFALQPGLLLNLPDPLLAGPTLVLLMAVVLCVAIVSGVQAERARLRVILWMAAVLAGVVVSLAAYWSWGHRGWLGRLGFRDSAGAGAIHLVGGLSAAVLALAVGPRSGKYNRDGSSNAIPGHSLPLATVGVTLMLLAWPLYAAAFGAALDGRGAFRMELAAVNVMVAAASGALASAVFCMWRYRKVDMHLLGGGLLGAAVAISASPHGPLRLAVAVGILAGVLVCWLTLLLDVRLRLDDPIGAVAIHGGGGLLGLLAASFATQPASLAQWGRALGVQALGAVAIASLALLASALVVLVLKATGPLRVPEADEYDGLDLAEHDLGAYPDFQQNTIKSYHLREV
jgi:Amt family ammonium transporter